MSDRHLHHLVRLDDVVLLDVVVVVQQAAGLQAGTGRAAGVLEAAQAGDAALVHLAAVTGCPRPGATADDSVGDVRSGDVAFARDTDDLADGGVADDLFLVLRFDLTADHALNVFDQLVDDAVRAQGDALPFSRLDDASGWVDAEGEQIGRASWRER